MKSVTTWLYSTETEAERVIHASRQIVNGFFKINNFLVLPQAPLKSSANIVIFPKLNYKKIRRFWSRAAQIDIYKEPIVIEPRLKESVVELLEEVGIEKPKYQKVKSLWQQAETQVIKSIYQVLPDKKDSIKKITIKPSCFDTTCSFSRMSKNGEITIYLRQDQGIHTITEAIITSITRNDIYDKLEGTWNESEIITDYLVTQTAISKVLMKFESQKEYTPTLKGVRAKDVGHLSSVSEEYLKELEIPSFSNPFSLNGLVPEINKKPIENLSLKERMMMYTLIKNKNSIVTFDQIADILFNTYEKYSLFAISKAMQRLRDKIEQNEISGSFIQTVRGKGYLLRS